MQGRKRGGGGEENDRNLMNQQSKENRGGKMTDGVQKEP
jgi:hypothetical protein